MTKAVFFDVDFTLIYPGPTFQGEGYQAFSAKHGIPVDASRFATAVTGAAPLLDHREESEYHEDIFVAYTRSIIEGMGGSGDRLDACAREIYAEWAACHHFHLYDDVEPALRALAADGIKIGLISNSHRRLAEFQSHFELEGLIAGAISSSDHGFMKPHPSIFKAALRLVDVEPSEAVMVGDNIRQDVEGALNAGMRAVLLKRDGGLAPDGIQVIRSLQDLPAVL